MRTSTPRAARAKILFLFFVFAGIAFAQTWVQMQILTASNKAAYDYFGWSVSLTDNYALVGACYADPGGISSAGAAYVFIHSGTTWTEQAILTASNKAVGDNFGNSVSLTDNFALVGAGGADPGGTYNAGAAYVFVRSGITWVQQAILTASDKTADDWFGSSGSLTDNYALVGAFLADPGGIYRAGAAYVFVRSGTTWPEQAILTASNKAVEDRFGVSVSLTNDYALVGAYLADPGGISDAGAAYVFVRSGTTWTEQAILTASNKAASDGFGYSVSLTNDNTALIGAPGPSRTYTFTRVSTTWTQSAISNTCCPSSHNVAQTANYKIQGENSATVGGLTSAGHAVVFLNSDVFTSTRSRSRSRSRTSSRTRSSSRSHSLSKIKSLTQSRISSKSKSKSKSTSKSPNRSRSQSKSHKLFVPSNSQSRTTSNAAIPPQEVYGDESSSMMPVIAGSCGGVVGLAAVLFCMHKKRMDKKKQSNAANFVESQPTNTKTYYGKDLMMSNLSLGPDATPENLGSMFMSKKPNATSAIDSIMSMKPNHAVLLDAITQEISSSNKSQSPAKQVSRFNDYSDVSEVSFSQLEPIGSGAFGLVYRVELSMGVVAVKVPKSNFKQGSKQYNDLFSEAEFLSKLRHTNITLLLGYGNHSSGSIIFLMEFADSSLADVLKSGPLQPDLLLEYAHGIVRGLLYLHTHTPPISHRDLKPENVLLVGGVAKLADFGLATARDLVSKTTGFAGTPIWSPPESFEGMFQGPPGDIYTFGLLLWSMMTGKIPYEGIRFEGIYPIKTKNQVPGIPSNCPSNISKLMKQCWRMNPKQRPRANELETRFLEIRNL